MRTRKSRGKKASLTVEAALILPFYMICLLTLVSLFLIILTHIRIHSQIMHTAQKIARIRADGVSISLPEAGDMVADVLLAEDLRRIENGRDGIDLTGSRTDDPEYIQLCVSYRLMPLTNIPGVPGIGFSDRSLVHAWTGYENGFFPAEEYVYVTNDSSVYHLDRECSHIRLNVREVKPEDIGNLRNDNGSRYKACGHCHAKLTDEKLYITPEGDRYHNSITCSGLKRTVRAIKKSEIGDRRPCRRCGR